jgi:uncharacterized protein
MENGGFVLLNGLSGAIDVLSDKLAQILSDKMKTTDYREIYFDYDLLPSEIESLFIKRGHITSVTHEKEQQHLEQLADILHKHEVSHRQIVIVPRIDCNYRCVYCFERPLQNKLDQNTISVMDKLTVEKVYTAIAEIKNRGDSVSKSILLYGGEPLNAAGKIIVDEIVERGIKEGFDFQAITNGHDLDVYLPIMGKSKISSIQVSIDGRYLSSKLSLNSKIMYKL